jgi:Animal haem peroxidase
LLGLLDLPPYKDFDASVDPSTVRSFSAAVFKFRYSKCPPTCLYNRKAGRCAADTKLLKDTSFDAEFFDAVCIEPVLLDAAHQLPPAVDTLVVDTLTGSLFAK